MKIGAKIKCLRVRNGLTQEEVADRCELSKGFISQVERDLTSPSIATLIDILACLGTDLPGFFSESADEKIVFSRHDVFMKKNESLGADIRWLIPNAQKNQMEPIQVVLAPGGRTEEESPHQGEEYGYLLAGRIDLVLGGRAHPVKPGESFCFRPSENHYVRNRGKTRALLLWVVTPPSF